MPRKIERWPSGRKKRQCQIKEPGRENTSVVVQAFIFRTLSHRLGAEARAKGIPKTHYIGRILEDKVGGLTINAATQARVERLAVKNGKTTAEMVEALLAIGLNTVGG